MEKYKITQIGNNIYMYKGTLLIAKYSKETKMLYTYGLSKNEKRKIVKIIKAKLRNAIVERNNKMIVI